ncbi:MAG: PKD domain-containing protein, partial [Bacteroidetes bacterium]|nr:PKD domain-containing protein [Bacteroidota bacterium]
MKKIIALSFLFLITIPFFLSAKTPDPFHLPASIPVPEWVKQVDWSAPNVQAIDKIIYQYKKSASAVRNEEQKPEQLGDADKRGTENEEPYETAYIRWRMQMEMKKAIAPDGSVVLDENKYLQDLKDRAGDQRRLSSSMMSGNWTELGPIESFDDNNAGPGFDQANVYCIAIAPSNDNLLYCGTEDGAIFKTIDKGQHWTCVSNALPANAPVSIAIDPADENIVYVRLSSTILKTIDGGTNWTVLGFNGGSAEKIIVLPNSRVLTIGVNEVFYSDNAGSTWTPSTGLPTLDQLYDVRARAFGNDTIFVSGAVSNLLRIFISTDAGASFTNVTGSNFSVENTGSRFATSLADPSIVYCCALGNTTPPTLLKSTDGGFTWTVTVLATGTGLGGSSTTVGLGMSNGQGYYDFDIMADPNNADNLIVATTSSYKSTDGGYNFSPLGGYAGGPISMHVDIQCMLATPTDAYISSDGGVLHSTDFFSDNANAISRNHGITGSNYWGFGQGWQEDITTGGRYHNGNDAMFSDNYGAGNSLNLGGGESGTGHVFPGRERTVGHNDIGVSQIPNTMAEAIQYNIFSNAKWPSVNYYYQFHGKLVVHPWYRNVFYVGEDSILWRSNNSGQSYSAFKNFGSGDVVWRFEIARSNVNVMYVLTENGIYKTADNGTTWTTLTLPVAYQYYNADVAVNPEDENEVYICMANGNANEKVFKSTNGRANWTNYTGTALNGKYIYALNFQGGTDGGVYATSQDNPAEMFYRDNTMSDWDNFSSGLFPSHLASACPLIFYRDNKIRLPGLRGIMESPLYSQGTPLAQAMCNREYLGCEKDTVEFYDYSMLNYSGAIWQWSFPGASWVSGVNERNPKVLYAAPGNYDVTLTVTDALGHSDTRTFSSMVQFPQSYCAADTVIGNCMALATSNRSIDIGKVDINSNTFSISTWVKPDGVQVSFAEIVAHYPCPGSPNYGFGLGITFSGYTPNLQLCYTDDQVNYGNYSGLIMDSTRWNNVVLTYSPTGVKIYLNGIVADVNTNTMPALDFTQAPFYINPDLHNQGGYFRGQIDELKFYNYTLSQDEVREKMHLIQSIPLSESGLVKYIQFNQLDPATACVYDVVNGIPVSTIQNTIITSTAPVSTGTVYRNPMVNSPGLNDFPGADLKMYLPSSGTYPDGEMVAFHLRSNPDQLPDTRPSVPGYFILNNFGNNASYTSPDSLIFSGLKNLTPANEANEFLMFNRNSFDYGSTWQSLSPASSRFNYINTQNSELTWLSSPLFTSGGQYVIIQDTSLFTTIQKPQPIPTMEMSVFPNPTHTSIYLTLHSSETREANISVFDTKGSCVINLVQKVMTGENTIMIPVQNMPMGVYEVVVGTQKQKS